MTLQNVVGQSVAEGICHSVNSNLVLGFNGPLGDSHVAVQISRSLSTIDIPDEWRYSLRAWPIERVYCNGASLRDHEVCYNYNCRQASLSQPSSSQARLYTSVVTNPPQETCVKAQTLLTQDSINAVSSKVCCSNNCVHPFRGRRFGRFVNACTRKHLLISGTT